MHALPLFHEGQRTSNLEPEWMDDPRADPAQLQRSLRFIRRVNILLGYTRATLRHLQRFSRAWKPGQRIRIVDLGTGSADIPRAILRWAEVRGFDVHIVGVERHGRTARMAVDSAAANPRLKIVQGDVLNMPLRDGTFDYALTAMFLHHLSDAQAGAVLVAMDRLARRGVIVADLLRTRRAYRWIRLFTALSNPMVRHDAALSVLQAFSKPEAIQLAQNAGLGYVRYYAHFGHRFVLAGEKGAY
jgi:ubiquinone/menaquinone biosynthesis C-methylase UbiE